MKNYQLILSDGLSHKSWTVTGETEKTALAELHYQLDKMFHHLNKFGVSNPEKKQEEKE